MYIRTLVEVIIGQLLGEGILKESAVRINQKALQKTLNQSGVGCQYFIHCILITTVSCTCWL